MILIKFLEFTLISAGYCAKGVTWDITSLTMVNEIADYLLVFIVSISLLLEILNACQNKIQQIVAYTFLNVCEKIHQFLLSIEKDAHERRSILFFLRKAHCKVTPVQRTLGKFYRPASITKVPQSSGPRSAGPQKV